MQRTRQPIALVARLYSTRQSFAKSIPGKFETRRTQSVNKGFFPANKATNRPDRQDTRGQVFHVFSYEIQTVSRCIVSSINYTAPLLQTYVLQ